MENSPENPMEAQRFPATAVITGATSGFGRATAKALAARGVRLLLLGRDERRGRETLAEIRAQMQGHFAVVESAASPSRSVLAMMDEGPADQPLLVTTADHALLSVEMVEHFLGQAEVNGGDVNLALVSETVLRARFPESVRTYLPFAGERYSGANLFAFLTPRSRSAVEFWVRAEGFRKRPWRLVSTFGPIALLLFIFRRLDLEAAFGRVSNAVGARVRELPITADAIKAAMA